MLMVSQYRSKYCNLWPILCKGNIPQRNGALTVDRKGIKCHTLEHERSTHRNEETTSRTSQGYCKSFRPRCKRCWLKYYSTPSTILTSVCIFFYIDCRHSKCFGQRHSRCSERYWPRDSRCPECIGTEYCGCPECSRRRNYR